VATEEDSAVSSTFRMATHHLVHLKFVQCVIVMRVSFVLIDEAVIEDFTQIHTRVGY